MKRYYPTDTITNYAGWLVAAIALHEIRVAFLGLAINAFLGGVRFLTTKSHQYDPPKTK